MIKVKRIYEERDRADGYRVLVDRLWPRGVKKDSGAIDLWMKEIAPGTELRKWFHANPTQWQRFRQRYERELKSRGELLDKLRELEEKYGTITLLYSSRSTDHNHAMLIYEALSG